MLRNYLTIAIRSLRRHWLFSLININGLAIGIAAFWIIAIYIAHELSYDRFHTHAERIYRVVQHAQWD